MTKENDKNEHISDNEENDDKTAKIAEKLDAMGESSSSKKEPEKKTRFFSPLLITLLLAIPVAGYILYINMPDQFNKWTSMLNFSSDADNSVTDDMSAENEQSQFADNSAEMGDESSSVNDALSNSSKSQMMAGKGGEVANNRSGSLGQAQEPEWLVTQRNDMEKRRAEYNKKHPESEWAAKQRADMEKRRLEFQKISEAQYATRMKQPEPPQWVKDRQAAMEKQMAQYNKNWSNNAMQNNRPSAYRQQPVMNPYQQNNAAMNGRVPPGYNPVNGYQQPPRQYYRSYYPPNPYYNNAPYNGYRPFNGPFGR